MNSSQLKKARNLPVNVSVRNTKGVDVMKSLLTIFTLVFTLFVANTAFSADFQKGLTAYNSGDYATASALDTLANQGNASAQYNLGVMYANGHGVPQDHKTAVKWYTLAANQGDAHAQYNLGLAYETGRGVPQNYVYAHMRLNIAASSGDDLIINLEFVKDRDSIAKRMNSSQLEKAKYLAGECIRKEYKGC